MPRGFYEKESGFFGHKRLKEKLRHFGRFGTLSFSILFFTVFGMAVHVFATPPTSPYTPGETLDPNCSPGDINCSIGILESLNEGTNLSFNTKVLNFVGAGVTATNSSDTITVTIAGTSSLALNAIT